MTYCNSVLEFKQKAFKAGLCRRYTDTWTKAEDNKDLADMVMTIQGADFICASVENKWGMANNDLMLNLYDFANGNYVRKCKGYNAELYMAYDGKIVVKSTLYIVLNSEDVEIYIPHDRATHIYIAGCINAKIKCDGIAYIVNYGKCNIKVDNGNKGTVKVTDPSVVRGSWFFRNIT